MHMHMHAKMESFEKSLSEGARCSKTQVLTTKIFKHVNSLRRRRSLLVIFSFDFAARLKKGVCSRRRGYGDFICANDRGCMRKKRCMVFVDVSKRWSVRAWIQRRLRKGVSALNRSIVAWLRTD